MKIPKLIIPILVLVFVAGGYAVQPLFFFPTTNVQMGAEGNSRVEFIVDGIRCRGTAAFFTSLFENVKGIESITTYADSRKAVFVYDSKLIDPEKIQLLFEREFRMQDGSFQPLYRAVERSE
jgi:hypothetical protein